MKKRDRDAGKNDGDLLPEPEETPGEKLYAGNWISRNVWIKLGLSPEQSKLLKSFSNMGIDMTPQTPSGSVFCDDRGLSTHAAGTGTALQ